MDNPISINLGDNNSMKSLVFHWIAIFNDGTKIEQFNSDNTENRFKLVQDKMESLKFFNLTNKNGKLFSVNLKEGIIGYNDLILPYRISTEIKNNIRLIYFRRHRVTMTASGKESNHEINYHLGFQYNDLNGNNRQIVLKIDEQGNWILGD